MTEADNTVSLQHFYVIVLAMVRAGWKQAEALAALGLDEFSNVDAEQRINFQHYVATWQKASELSKDVLFGLKAGTRSHPGDYGEAVKATIFSKNLDEAHRLIYRYQSIINPSISTSIVETADSVIYPMSIGALDPELAATVMEFRMTTSLTFIQFITGNLRNDLIEEVCFQHKPRRPIAEYEEILRTNVKFSQPRTSYRLPKAAMEVPCWFANAEFQKAVIAQAEQVSAEVHGEDKFYLKIVQILKPQLAKGIPSLEDLARQLHISSSTFKRRLRKEKISYQRICNKLRQEISTDLLLNSDKNISEIAKLIGFSSHNSFVKAFKRWTSKTPQEFRQD